MKSRIWLLFFLVAFSVLTFLNYTIYAVSGHTFPEDMFVALMFMLALIIGGLFTRMWFGDTYGWELKTRWERRAERKAFEKELAEAKAELPPLDELPYGHHVWCNYWSKPIGGPGCICHTAADKYDLHYVTNEDHSIKVEVAQRATGRFVLYKDHIVICDHYRNLINAKGEANVPART